MTMRIDSLLAKLKIFGSAALAVTLMASSVNADPPVVPGTGREVVKVGDDFEDVEWKYKMNGAKSSKELDERTRSPAGESVNDRWYEGIKRGQPDIIRRVETPAGGLAGSEGSLELRSLKTGIPGRPSHRMQQDDFICNVHYRVGEIPMSKTPNCVVRVFFPPVDEWENRSGPQFAFRAALETVRTKPSTGFFFSGSKREEETYWPGFFVEFQNKDQTKAEYDTAYLRIRANSRGGDFKGMQITQTGWWTLGMSFTPDGQVHYYAKPGIEDLTEEDYLTSQYPYGFRGLRFKTFFFNVCNGDNGKTWSTSWIIDDPKLYLLR